MSEPTLDELWEIVNASMTIAEEHKLAIYRGAEGVSAPDALAGIQKHIDAGLAARVLYERARSTPDTTEATLDHIAWAQAIRLKHEATHGEAEQCGAECIVLGLTEFDEERLDRPGDTTEATLRAALLEAGGHLPEWEHWRTKASSKPSDPDDIRWECACGYAGSPETVRRHWDVMFRAALQQPAVQHTPVHPLAYMQDCLACVERRADEVAAAARREFLDNHPLTGIGGRLSKRPAVQPEGGPE